MKMRRLGKTGLWVSEIGLGCWQLGGDFGPMEDTEASTILANASRLGVNFWDTADVYGNGLSEHRIGTFYGKPEDLVVATKVGRSASLYPDKYTKGGIKDSLEESARRLLVETIDLAQLHCVPREVLEAGEIFTWMNEIQAEGLISNWGASVETIAEAEICLEQEGLSTLQIIFNIFRQDAADGLLEKARDKDVGIIVRLPLASGLLSGKYSAQTEVSPSDHRSYNREGQAFSVGETFGGIPFEKGVELAGQLRGFVPEGQRMSLFALRWILDHDAVSTVITGVSRPEQIGVNAEASDMAELSPQVHAQLSEFYRDTVRRHIRGEV
jgi:aryl-alcohol dehydrogenase-like predicted oxidoreductase